MNFAEWTAQVEAKGGTTWVEEQLTRGKPGGGINGGHVVFGGEISGRRFLSDPQPLTVDVGDEDFKKLVAVLNAEAITAAAQLVEISQQVQQLTTERDALVTTRDQQAATIATLTAERDALLAAFGGTEAGQAAIKAKKLADAKAARKQADKVIAALESAEDGRVR